MADFTTIGDATALVQEGRAALMAGDTYTARQYFRQALEVQPMLVAALIGMAGTVRAYREKRDYLLQALEIEPGHPEAQAILVQVEARLTAGEILAPSGVVVRESDTSLLVAHDPIPVATVPAAEPEWLFCYNHPNRETGLRCTSCDRPICADCVRPAAVGQLCPSCARSRRPVNYQVATLDLFISGVIAVVYAFGISIAAGIGLGITGFFSLILAIILGPSAGELLVRLLEKVNRKRGRSVQIVVALGYVIGAAPIVAIFFNVGLIIFTIAAVATTVTRLR